ncbi:MAG: lysophospholipid acyltransferase family protein [Rhodovarius sp.]|nr:1-acyl-sn-glycerol-3-phosphate acyltransferase [Rhodovarius sp.]MCX7933363.1 1-acyl-sn-glycerol-3-phosphate acyltransferase [Rhodovarius sp.]MDW8313813.1 lysophospholipid acyltransferase family protein [Rhodovarius sp.]
MILLRSVLFNLAFFGTTAAMALAALPALALPRRVIRRLLRLYAQIVLLLMRGILDLRVRLEGAEHIPAGPAIIASKHQSAFDTIFWLSALPDACYVLKRELLAIPVWGWHARRAGMIPVDRAGGGAALRRMVRIAAQRAAEGRSIIIYPEGTRTAPGSRLPYQPGVAALAAALRLPVVPVATNSGLFWGRRAFLKRPGTIVVRVLPPLPPGLPRDALIARLEEAIETASAALLPAPARPAAATPVPLRS